MNVRDKFRNHWFDYFLTFLNEYRVCHGFGLAKADDYF